MSINLNSCDKACVGCIKGYKKKHGLIEGMKFSIKCDGIPKEYISPNIAASMTPEEVISATTMLDPVSWAAETLDWHCTDPDGEVWKRRDPEEYYTWIKEHPGQEIAGHSRYERPYQKTMLQCTAKRKIFRCGRQLGKTESMIVSMLFHLFTKPGIADNEGFKIIIITPYQSQIDLIFSRALELIRSNPTTANSVKRNVKSPQYAIELHNGSVMRGFTAGTKSGNNAGAVRGQHAHMLVFDEADYLSAEDVDAALSIVTNFPNASVWMSSTPTGKREKFYQTAQSKIFKEFHFPSLINPMWNKELDTLFKEQLTSLGYKHEILAEFGEQEEGVFQNVYVQAGKESYNYGDFAYDPRWTYMMGVDWNDIKIGTTIAINGYNPNSGLFYTVDRHVIKREGWTQLQACQKIAELNAIWNPANIYVDKGFGGTQFEVLKKYGFDAMLDPQKGPGHPDSRLRYIIKQYDFGSKIEVHDLITKEPVDKAAKPFLVENMVRRMETNTYRFSAKDTQLENEFLGYIIDRITQNGIPVYKAGNETIGDHNLDAVMLAQVAFTLEKTAFGKPTFTSGMVFSGQFGERKYEPENLGLVVKPETKSNRRDYAPEMTRTDTFEKKQSIFASTEIPANHTNVGKTKPWKWEGFLKDEPAPQTRSFNQAMKETGQRRGFRPKLHKPTRKNI